MIVFLLLALAVRSVDQDLPFEDETVSTDSTNQNDEQDDAENVDGPTPTPTPTPVVLHPVPLKEIMSLREVLAAGIFVLYIITFFAGRAKLKAKFDHFYKTCLPLFRDKYFAIVPEIMQYENIHKRKCYITGRTGYQGGILTVEYPYSCDPLGILYSAFQNRKPTLTVELICQPLTQPNGIIRITKDKPHFFDQYKLKMNQIEADPHLKCFTDFGDVKKEFIEKVNDFLADFPRSIQMIEASDLNDYETRLESNYVARFEIILNDPEILCERLVDFIMDFADTFVTLQLSKDQLEKNDKLRNALIAERQRRQKEEEEKNKKLSPEEQKRLEEKQERRERRRNSPKIKYVKK
ncbi:hypothetical protein TVAG_225310 [Trichomonas vaginalis G3]|uniref:Uncharacterized protein n=1 Tax=Trichomonas vaginalis (strain ATCC PRA-98 / G3) TaxID=412133 RepID=A2DNR0_TRIV3|nr:adipocyte-specific protein 4-related family [Trichomonas vaginalis G3]EAY17905.1 hypothetical protein TVAG_225310 [Trichomonas vaginalis G3]KAI5527068.1 adipocyte-specific protein 4-related family [Trichomonas vaginalis G3]|eukprot:XP_001578891.1 hypothetical protein [Trichomonas vaginalis G3]